MITPADAIAKLDALGSARQIADHLHQLGLHGNPGQLDTCPVARYVAVETLSTVLVGAGWWTPDVRTWWNSEATQLPDNVTDFVVYFDESEYPELIAAEDAALPYR